MKEKIIDLVSDRLVEFQVYIDDVFVSVEEGKKLLNIVLDSNSVIIDLNLITEASRVINQIIDKNNVLDDDIYEVDIYSKEKEKINMNGKEFLKALNNIVKEKISIQKWCMMLWN